MRKNWIKLGVMFSLVAGLSLFAWLKPPKAPGHTVACHYAERRMAA